LRAFELGLLHEIGYAPNLVTDAVMHEALLPEQMYEFHVEQGALPVADRSEYPYCFTGELLLAIGRRDFSAPEKLLGARRLLRFVINHYVGEPGLRTRKVAAAMKR
jgi:DNA repair protein RecO (recombination protein O)